MSLNITAWFSGDRNDTTTGIESYLAGHPQAIIGRGKYERYANFYTDMVTISPDPDLRFRARIGGKCTQINGIGLDMDIDNIDTCVVQLVCAAGVRPTINLQTYSGTFLRAHGIKRGQILPYSDIDVFLHVRKANYILEILVAGSRPPDRVVIHTQSITNLSYLRGHINVTTESLRRHFGCTEQLIGPLVYNLHILENLPCGLLTLELNEDVEPEAVLFTGNPDLPEVRLHKFRNTGRRVYTIDFGHNLSQINRGELQPCGHLLLGTGCYIQVLNNCGFRVSYMYYDVLRCSDNSLSLLSQNTVHPDYETVFTQDLHGELGLPPLTLAPPIFIPDPPAPAHVHNEVNNMSLMKRVTMHNFLLDRLEKSKAFYQYAAEPCVITYEPIMPGEYYYECPECHKHISFDACREWLERSNKCPHCTDTWYFYPYLFQQISPQTAFLLRWKKHLAGLAYLSAVAFLAYRKKVT